MISYFEILNDGILNSLHRDCDLVMPFLLRNEEGTKGEFLIGLELLLSRLEAQNILILFGDSDAICDFGL